MTALAIGPGEPTDAPRRRPSTLLGGLAFALFLASLACPAADVTFIGPPSHLRGWDVAWLAPYVGGAAVVEAFVKHQFALAYVGHLLVCLAGLSNVLMLLPLRWLKLGRVRSPSRRLTMSWVAALALAIVAPFTGKLTGLDIGVQAGYGVWLAAWLALGAALWAARREAVTP